MKIPVHQCIVDFFEIVDAVLLKDKSTISRSGLTVVESDLDNSMMTFLEIHSYAGKI